MIEFFANIDDSLLLFFNSMRYTPLDHFVLEFSGRAIWVPLYIAIAAMMIRCYGWRRGLVYILAVAAAVGLSDLLCDSLIRPMVARLRPSNPDNPLSAMVQLVDGYRSGSYGFPSCHAANTFALATASALLMRARGYTAAIYAWALCQCYSRLYLGVHYPGDLLAGACIGALMGYLAAKGATLLPITTPPATADRAGALHRQAAIGVTAVLLITIVWLLITTI